MQSPQGDAPIGLPPQDRIPGLAELYDRFAQALDPDSRECNDAERAFHHEVLVWYENLHEPRGSFHDFRKGVIARCRKHLLATQKPPTI